MIWVRVRHLSNKSSLAIYENGGKRAWSATDYLLADLWELYANRGIKRGQSPVKHPARPVVKSTRSAEAERRHSRALSRHRRQVEKYYGRRP